MTYKPPSRPPVAVAVPLPTVEDRVLKFIIGHNAQIWLGIAALAVVVVALR